MQNLIKIIATKIYLSFELQKQIKLNFKIVNAKKGDIILYENNKANYLYFIEKGVLHNYYHHNDRQITSWFYTENQFVTSWNSFYSQKLSFENIECLEDCTLYKVSYSNYQKLITDFLNFNNFARLLAEEMLEFIDNFSKGWAFLSAKEKYLLLKTHFPQIELRVKLGYIASFLGISQETLSRIRSEK